MSGEQTDICCPLLRREAILILLAGTSRQNLVGLNVYRGIGGCRRLGKWRLLSNRFDVLGNAEF